MSGDQSQRGASWAVLQVLVLFLLSSAIVSTQPALAASARTIAASQYHSCAVTTGGGVKCWGTNADGQLGDGTTTTRLAPVDVSGLTYGAVAVVAGRRHTCALTSGGGVKCWGHNVYGQLGDGTTTDRLTPVDVSGLATGVVAIGAGGFHTCAITAVGGLKCWGRNVEGQLGDGTTTNRPIPVDVSGLASGVIAMSGGGYHSCALTAGGGAKCWGYNAYGQLGDGTTISRMTPTDVTGLTSGVTTIAAADSSQCALENTGGMECWGNNADGQLGDGTTTTQLAPVAVSGLASGVAALGAGFSHVCAVMSTGGVTCWGDNAYGQLGDGTTADRLTPVAVSGLVGAVATIAGGERHTCAVTAAGGVVCWGGNSLGQLGDGTTTNRLTPVGASGLAGGEGVAPTGARALAAAMEHTCLVTLGGGVKCWGSNTYGQLGDGTTTTRMTPVDVAGLTHGIAAVAAGSYFTCALTVGGGVKCWGRNYEGQLGDGTTTTRTIPVDVSGLTSGVTAVAVGDSHGCVLTTAGGVKCWGLNSFGQLGDGTTTTRTTPVDVIGLSSGVASVSAGLFHSCVVTTGTGVKCWGQNYEGQLGDGTTAERPTPVDVSGLTSGIASVSGGGYHTCALTTGGGAKCWGNNTYGQVGDGTTTNSLVPVDVSGLSTGVARLAAGHYFTCAVLHGGKAQCWGDGNNGNLGDGSTVDRSAPVDVFGLTAGVAAVSAGYFHTCAVTAWGGVQCWGGNYDGELGDGTTTLRVTPVWVSGMVAGVGALEAGAAFACRLTASLGVQCWGDNSHGQLGDGTTTDRRTPVDVLGLTDGVVQVRVGMDHSCALLSSGGVKCWGYNNDGQVGDGTTTDRLMPVDVVGRTSGTVAIAAECASTCALTAAGGIQCWGRNSNGQLGDGTTTNRTTPVWVSGLTAWAAALVGGIGHTCALTIWGGVKCWGWNGHGQLGDGTTTNRTVPVDVIGLTSGVRAVASGSMSIHTCALTSAGGVKCWGLNGSGQLGDGTTTTRTTPVDVAGLASGVAAVAMGASHTCALTSAGGVKCWGYNGRGQLGDGTTTTRATPTDVTGLTSGAGTLAVDWDQTCAVTVTGGMKCWGGNTDGQLGDGTLTDRWTPVSVRGFILEDDYDGDVKADVAVYRPSTGTWFSLDSSTNNMTSRYHGWGVEAQNDTPAPGDYDGDGIVDPTVFRPGTGTWFILESSSNYTAYSYVGWGTTGDVPVPADYDGDGKTDVAVYRPSTGTWYVRPSSGATQWSVVFGNATDVPIPGLFESDGKADIAVYRPSTGTWFVLTSASGYTDWWYQGWGIQAQGDVPAPGDYDGDGKIDLCVFRPGTGTWFIRESREYYSTWNWFGWGASGDTAVPNDYDGDGITDAAVYRASTGTWYVRPSTGAMQWSVVFGQSGDVPLLKIQ